MPDTTKKAPRRPLPGRTWSILAHGTNRPAIDLQFDQKSRTTFDELIIDDWFHIEQMDDRAYWVRVGPLVLFVRIPSNGEVDVSVEVGDTEAGTYRAFEWDADGSAAFCLAPEADYKARLERTSRAIHARHGRRNDVGSDGAARKKGGAEGLPLRPAQHTNQADGTTDAG